MVKANDNIAKTLRAAGAELSAEEVARLERWQEVQAKLLDREIEIDAFEFFLQGSSWGDPKTTLAFNIKDGCVCGHGFYNDGAFFIDGTCSENVSAEFAVTDKYGRYTWKLIWQQTSLTGIAEPFTDTATFSQLTLAAYEVALREWRDSQAHHS